MVRDISIRLRCGIVTPWKSTASMQPAHLSLVSAVLQLRERGHHSKSRIVCRFAGIDTVGFGPSGEAAHGANEAVYVDDLVTQAQVYIATVRNLLA